MSSKHNQTAAKVQTANGETLTLVASSKTSPLPAIEDLERLHTFRPDLVDVVIELTKQEAEERRKRTRVNDFRVFIGDLISRIGAIVIALIAFIGAIFLGMNDHGYVAASLVCGALAPVIYAINRASRS